MCELLGAAATEPFALGDLWDLVAGLERYGLAGFGWGAAWVTPKGGIAHHVTTGAFRDDQARAALAAVRSTALMVHLRRPSRLSTIGLPDSQPFIDPRGRFAFSHNGDLAGFRPVRLRYLGQGRIGGRADSEVGQRWLEDRWDEHEREPAGPAPDSDRDAQAAPDACRALAALHGELGGQANLMALTPEGVTHIYAGNTENPVFRYRLGRIGVVSTGLYSIDRSLFRLVAPTATDRHVLRPSQRHDLAPGA